MTADAASVKCFVNVQDNGVFLNGSPFDYSDPNETQERAELALRTELQRGVVTLPTTITPLEFDDGLKALERNAAALSAVGMEGRWQHAEWPFFLPTDGAIGAHPKSGVMKASVETLRRMVDASNDTIAIISVGADVPGIEEVISDAVRHDITILLAHQVPSIEQIEAAIAAADGGNIGLGHLWNGVPKQIERQGFLDYVLNHPKLRAVFIPDGTHVKLYDIDLLFKVKEADRVIAVSDRASYGGADPSDEWRTLWGSKVKIVEHPTLDTNMIVGENGYFAGSWANMLQCMNYLASLGTEDDLEGSVFDFEPLPEEDLWLVGRDNPLELINKSAAVLDGIDVCPLSFNEERSVFTAAGN